MGRYGPSWNVIGKVLVELRRFLAVNHATGTLPSGQSAFEDQCVFRETTEDRHEVSTAGDSRRLHQKALITIAVGRAF